MSSITIRNLPDAVKTNLALRARASGESLEALVREILAKEAGAKTNEAWPDLVNRLAREAAALPPSDPESFDIDRALLRSRNLSRPPVELDWWPDQPDAETAER